MHFISISVYKTNKVIELWEIKKKINLTKKPNETHKFNKYEWEDIFVVELFGKIFYVKRSSVLYNTAEQKSKLVLTWQSENKSFFGFVFVFLRSWISGKSFNKCG